MTVTDETLFDLDLRHRSGEPALVAGGLESRAAVMEIHPSTICPTVEQSEECPRPSDDCPRPSEDCPSPSEDCPSPSDECA